MTTEAPALLERRHVVYCGACGMPPEYCEYGPDFETHCNPWLSKNEPQLYAKLKELRSKTSQPVDAQDDQSKEDNRPTAPWTTEERLTAFYEKYEPSKVSSVASLLEKYAGKEDKLFTALVKKYGPEPDDPYYDDEDEDESLEGEMGELSVADKKKRRGVSAKKSSSSKEDSRVVIQKVKRSKKKFVTIVIGMDTVPGLKLKDVSKTFSKRFAGSSSVKDTTSKGKEIIIQGDHMDDVAEMVVSQFNVPADSVYLDIDGEFVPYNAA